MAYNLFYVIMFVILILGKEVMKNHNIDTYLASLVEEL